jgi:phytanoyl-CoA hydroxylase
MVLHAFDLHYLTMKKKLISQEQIDCYWEKGWVVVESVFNPQEVEHIAAVATALGQEELRAAATGKDVGLHGALYTMDKSKEGSSAPRKIDYPFEKNEHFKNLLLSERLVGIIGKLIGGIPLLVRDQIFLKPPRCGSAKPYHQDNAHFLCSPGDKVITVWIALDDVDEENGCLRYIDRSHKGPILPHEPIEGEPHNMAPPTDLIDLNKESLAPVPKGGVVFHHSQTLHTSHRNESDRWRRAYATHWATADVTSETSFIENSYYNRGLYKV